MEYSNTAAYHHSLETLWRKFKDDARYVTQTFPHADDYSFEFWAPVVSGWQKGGPLIDGLTELSKRFEAETGDSLAVIINQGYTTRIDELRS
jgi:hypothetical protein